MTADVIRKSYTERGPRFYVEITFPFIYNFLFRYEELNLGAESIFSFFRFLWVKIFHENINYITSNWTEKKKTVFRPIRAL